MRYLRCVIPVYLTPYVKIAMKTNHDNVVASMTTAMMVFEVRGIEGEAKPRQNRDVASVR